MKKFLLTAAFFSACLLGKAQFTQNDLVYYVGEGPDTAIFVVDFLDETVDTSYAWGFLFDETATITAETMMLAIAADEPYLSINIDGAFLDEISYNAHIGTNGDPNFWGTWSKTAATDWETNDGVSEELSNGDWFGCSYTDFDPAITPGEPLPAYASTKFTSNDVQFWVGSGADSAVFVVDFVTDEFGEAVSYAWGYLFDGSTDAATMLLDISEADMNLTINAEAFLNDILFNGLEGIGGDPHYWGTYSGTNLSDWTLNAGLGTVIADGDWFGCSYDAWQPRRPFYPISANDATQFDFGDVEFIVGEGVNQTVIVIDFNAWLPGLSYAFGYLFDTETVTAEQVLNDLSAFAPYGLNAIIEGGFLTTIEYEFEAITGVGGMPDFWSTWSANNSAGWELNSGISTELVHGDWFACSYTNYAPATPPSMPQPAIAVDAVNNETFNVSLYPNPAVNVVRVMVDENVQLTLVDISGKVVHSQFLSAGANTINIEAISSGMYHVQLSTAEKMWTSKLVKH